MSTLRSLLLLCLYFATGAPTLAQQPVIKDTVASNKVYIIQDSVLVSTPDGAHISALVVRKKGATEPQATILQFTVYARKTDINKAKEAADKGYAGMIAYTRGKRYSPDETIPYEHDGEDVNAVINWITQQPWSNQQVGMYGGSYNGFTQWAATKHLHPALKTIVPSVAAAPGLDVPMTNNVVMSFPFPWTYYVTNNKFLDEEDYRSRQWDNLYQKWYDEGRSYRALDTLTGRPANKMFRRWLDHPSYDEYWQHMIPYRQDFAHINIPVLTTTGYYDGGQIGATYYLREHLKYNPHANHYFLIGPYGHFGAQGYPDSVYNGYRIDAAARISIHDIIYQWFDYVLKSGPKPAILKDKINYEVMGSNRWKHVASLNKMSNDTLTFYFANNNTGIHYGLSMHNPRSLSPRTGKDFIPQQINFADRTTRNSYYYAFNIVYDSLYTNNGLAFISEPLQQPMEISGCFSGVLKAMINKKDMDYSVALFEQMPDGRYFYLSYFMGRASYATGNTRRHLLTPGKKEALPFTNTYMTSKMLSKGSRIIAIVNINKTPFEQINYGTGKPVNEETIKDAGIPLQIKWYTDSYIKVPVWKE